MTMAATWLVSWQSLVLETIAKSLLLFLAAGMALIALRRASAAVRHLVWTFLFCALLALPLLSAALPSWRLLLLQSAPEGAPPILSSAETTPSGRSAPGGEAAATNTISPHPGSAIIHYPSRTAWGGPVGVDKAIVTAHPPLGGPVRSVPTHPARSADTWRLGAFVVWLAGVLLGWVRILVGIVRIRRYRQRHTVPAAEALRSQAARLAHEIGLRRSVTLLQCLPQGPGVAPITWGWVRPVVVLPADATLWPPDRLRSALLHEFAHIRRGDWPLQMLAQFTSALYWFHPLAWWAASRLRGESELACDDYVLRAGLAASDYATYLLEIVREMKNRRTSSGMMVAMAQPASMERRLRSILDGRRPRGMATRRVSLAALLVLATLLVPLAAMRVAARTPAHPGLRAQHESSEPSTPETVPMLAEPKALQAVETSPALQPAPRAYSAPAPRIAPALILAQEPGARSEKQGRSKAAEDEQQQDLKDQIAHLEIDLSFNAHELSRLERRYKEGTVGVEDVNTARARVEGLEVELASLQRQLRQLQSGRIPTASDRRKQELLDRIALLQVDLRANADQVSLLNQRYKAGQITQDELEAATARLQHLELEMSTLQRQLRELQANRSPAAYQPQQEALLDIRLNLENDLRAIEDSVARLRQLHAQGYVSQSALDAEIARQDRLEADLRQVQANLDVLQAGHNQSTALQQRQELLDKQQHLEIEINQTLVSIKRLRLLHEQGSLSQEELDAETARLDHLRVDLEQVKRRLKALEQRAGGKSGSTHGP